jgi:hypothetical protein
VVAGQLGVAPEAPLVHFYTLSSMRGPPESYAGFNQSV